MTCQSILRRPPPSVVATDIKGDRLTYEISFSTEVFTAAGEARSQLITELYKRARPAIAQQPRFASLSAEDLKPIIEARPELMEALSHYVAKMQQFLARFERSALEPVVIEQHDMLWRIKNFFRLDEVSGVNSRIRHTRRRNESESDRK